MDPLAHNDIERTLGAHRIGINASELHGSLCGYLCAGGAAGTNAWCEALALEALQDLITDDADARRTFAQFFSESRARLIDPQFGFEPLLPDVDEVPARAAHSHSASVGRRYWLPGGIRPAASSCCVSFAQ